MPTDIPQRQHSPAAERNKQPILDVLLTILPSTGLVLEIASGTGQHVAHFAKALPGIEWHPSDPDSANRRAIDWLVNLENLINVRSALDLDVRLFPWALSAVNAMVCINMIHHICPVDFNVTWLESNNDAGFDMIADSDDLRLHMVFAAYGCQ
ncbi:MAG: DUF938 domain-containing protein, partial [Burkholderiales bacterium]